jgi:hypothetical protein
MPAGWETLSAQAFVEAAEDLFGAATPPSPEHARAVVEHGWSTFLNNAPFISGASAETLKQMVRIIGGRRALRVDADTTAEQVAGDLETLNARVTARINSEPSLIAADTYEDVVDNFFFMFNANVPHPERIEPIGAFVASHNWQDLTLRQKSWLYWYLNTADRLDPQKFSARWTGQITAPSTGQYTFSQLRQFYIDGALKVWINNQLILDSTAAVTRVQGEEAPEVQEPPGPEDPSFQSQPITLTAGQPVLFRAELVYDRAALKRHAIFPERQFPVAVLQWQSATVPKQIIGPEAFTPPAGFGEAGAQGLRGEYFADTALSQSAGAHLDPGLQWIWNEGAVLSIYRDAQDAILANARPWLVQEANLAAIPADQRQSHVRDVTIRFVRGMTARDRILLIDRLAEHPELLAEMEQNHVEPLFRHTFMLPGQQHLKLLAAWGTNHEAPPAQIAHYPGTFPTGYVAVNHASYLGLTNWLWDL